MAEARSSTCSPFALADADKLSSVVDYDSVVQAFLPDEAEHPRLFAAVEKFMMHGPCGLHNPNCPCMQKGHCSKHFPKGFVEETLENVDGYPVYRRPNDAMWSRMV